MRNIQSKDENDRDINVKAYSEITFSIEGGNQESIPEHKNFKGRRKQFYLVCLLQFA
jgi:hypothetical protein